MHSWLAKGSLSAEEKEKAATELFELDVNKSATKKAKTGECAQLYNAFARAALFCTYLLTAEVVFHPSGSKMCLSTLYILKLYILSTPKVQS